MAGGLDSTHVRRRSSNSSSIEALLSVPSSPSAPARKDAQHRRPSASSTASSTNGNEEILEICLDDMGGASSGSPSPAETPTSRGSHVRRRSSNSSTLSGMVEIARAAVVMVDTSLERTVDTRAFRSSQSMTRDKSPTRNHPCSIGPMDSVKPAEHNIDGRSAEGVQTETDSLQGGQGVEEGSQTDTVQALDAPLPVETDGDKTTIRDNKTQPTRPRPEAPTVDTCNLRQCFTSIATTLHMKLVGGRRNACWDLLKYQRPTAGDEQQGFLENEEFQC